MPDLRERIAKILWEFTGDKERGGANRCIDKFLADPEIKEALELKQSAIKIQKRLKRHLPPLYKREQDMVEAIKLLELKRQGKLVKLAGEVLNIKSKSWQIVEPL